MHILYLYLNPISRPSEYTDNNNGHFLILCEKVLAIINDAIKAQVVDKWSAFLSTDNAMRMTLEYMAVMISVRTYF